MKYFAVSLLLSACVLAGIRAAAAATLVVATTPRVAGLRDAGPYVGSPTLAVSLKYRHADELERLVANQADPSSPLFGRFLSPRQFDAYFAPSEVDYARTARTLRAAGFSIRTYANRTLIDARAPAAVVERFFGTKLRRVFRPGYGYGFANAGEAFAPAALSDTIHAVAGFADVGRFHTAYHVGKAAARRADQLTGTSLFGPDYGYGPSALARAYRFPSAARATGRGQASAVVVDADFVDGDLSSYLRYFGVRRTGPPTVRVPVDGGPPRAWGSYDSVEATLDVETLVSLAPGTALYVYEFPNFSSDAYVLDAYERIVDDDAVGTATSSFGGCESAQVDGYAQTTEQLAIQGSALGITFSAATGDGGSLSAGCPSTSVATPASSPHFVALGGTSLYLDPTSGAVDYEFGWSGSGGGISAVFPLPAYQRSVRHVVPSGRNLPDLAFDGDASTGASLYYKGAFVGPVGGTSLASPIFSAGQTLLNELARSRAGFVNPYYYATFLRHGYAVKKWSLFRDVTSGNNGFYSATSGYDQLSGIGSAMFENLHAYVR